MGKKAKPVHVEVEPRKNESPERMIFLILPLFFHSLLLAEDLEITKWFNKESQQFLEIMNNSGINNNDLNKYEKFVEQNFALKSIAYGLINEKVIELKFGDYSKPKIFKTKSNDIISINDKQENKIYLFDSDANLLPNFPVFGSSSIDYFEDKLLQKHITTLGEKNEILIYTIN